MRGTFIFRVWPGSSPYGAENVTNGVARPERWTNAWVSPPLDHGPQWVELSWAKPVTVGCVHVGFDGQFDSNLTWPSPLGVAGCVNLPTIVKRYEVQVRRDGGWVVVAAETDNFHYRCVHAFDPVSTDAVRIVVHDTHGAPEARIFEIRPSGRECES